MTTVIKGRGALSRPPGRFERKVREAVDDGWSADAISIDDDDALPRLVTTLSPERAKTILTRNDSPDIPFDESINPYRGCEHGCIYCYARPSHAYADLSPGLDFETRLFYKVDAARLLRAELAKPGYVCKPIMLGSNTDPYQPVEREQRVTRQILEVLADCRHPVAIITKGALIERDLDLLADLAGDRLVRVTISLPTLDVDLKRILEPRAASVAARLRLMRQLVSAGVPVGVLVAPIIPAITDHEIERVLEACAAAGAVRANYVMLRLPYEVKQLFREWLAAHFPQRAVHVMSLVQDLRAGRDNDSCFGQRMSGSGALAALTRRRFDVACRRLGLDQDRGLGLETLKFRRPVAADRSPQMSLGL